MRTSAPSPWSQLADFFFGRDESMRPALQLSFIAASLYLLWAAGFTIWMLVHHAPDPVLYAFLLDDLGGMAFYAVIRSGVTRRFKDPALVLPQMMYAAASCALAYVCLPGIRPGLLQLACLVQVFGLFNLPPRQLLLNGLCTAAMFLMAAGLSVVIRPGEQVGLATMHAVQGALMLVLLTLISAHHARSRIRLRATRKALADAVMRTEALARLDPLTGLLNRQHAQELLQIDTARHDEGGRSFCVAFIDLDFFKRVNDVHGHAAGDAVLKHFAQQASSQLRELDSLARWGGEEFLLVLRDSADVEVAVQVLARLRARLEAAPLQLEGEGAPGSQGAMLHIRFSAGVAARSAGESLEQTIQRADRALYRAKALGRDRTEADKVSTPSHLHLARATPAHIEAA